MNKMCGPKITVSVEPHSTILASVSQAFFLTNPSQFREAYFFESKLRIAWRAWKWNDVANVGHPGDELHGSLQAQPKAGMRDRSIAAQVEIPPVGIGIETLFLHAALQYIKPFLALAAADDLAYPRHKNIHRADRFAVVVDAHVKGFNRARIIVEDDRLFEGLLGQIAFVFRLKILAPGHGKFERFASLLQNAHRLSVR